ncbi:MAG: peptide chain release factor aRF-1 [Candidatus Pacearchaeota archaeon]
MVVKKEELADLVEELQKYKGRATELISVYIPSGQNLYSVIDQLESEKSTAKNIKSTSTRKNVGNALDKITRHLREYKKTPENGLAIFCGNISQIEGQEDIRLWAVEPPIQLKVRMYRCDKEFILEPLKEMLEVSEIFGLLVMDRKEATIGLLEGKSIKILKKMTSGVPSKIRAGGQSSQRFHRITEGLTREFYKRVGEEMKNIFYDAPKLKGIIVGGPIPTKDEFLEGDYLPTPLKKKIIGVKDIGGSDESGLKELVERSKDILAEQEIIHEKEIIERFFKTLKEKPELVLYDLEKVKHALYNGAVDILIISRNIEKNLNKELKEIAENTSSTFFIVSNETEEAEQFFNITKGVGAILRYRIQ